MKYFALEIGSSIGMLITHAFNTIGFWSGLSAYVHPSVRWYLIRG